MTWSVPEYSRSHVDRAGFTYASDDANTEERELALSVINNWRSSHAFPLNTLQVSLRKRARDCDPSAIVAQRIKRLPSITAKISREHGMRLSRVQDIGGCRAVLDTVDTVKTLHEVYKRGNGRHSLLRSYDYLFESPKESGYRGIHLIYSYKSDSKATYNGLRIEIQIRSRLQHAWATAVETVGTFTQQALKSSQGQEEWLRFFSLMSSEFAFQEGAPRVPNTPDDRAELRRELRVIAERLDVAGRLNAYGNTLDFLDQLPRNARYFLLELNGSSGELRLQGFRSLHHATDAYDAMERATAAEPDVDVVLVSVESLTQLKRAYPNYFLDTTVFVNALEDVLSE